MKRPPPDEADRDRAQGERGERHPRGLGACGLAARGRTSLRTSGTARPHVHRDDYGNRSGDAEVERRQRRRRDRRRRRARP